MKRSALIVAAALLHHLAAAQQIELAPSPAVACLSPAEAAASGPEYPFLPFKRDLPGRVTVELTFSGPDAGPSVKVLSKEGTADVVTEFVVAVREHVRQFRVPCMQPGSGPVRLVQDYVFLPDQRRVAWYAPTDAEDTQRKAQLECVSHMSGKKAPEYPRMARREMLQGRVLAQLSFTAPDQPPLAKLYARPSARPLREAVQDWVAGLRMPCHNGTPVNGNWTFSFVMEGEAYGFRPLSLTQLLGRVKNIQQQTLAVDTTTMGCPFDLRFAYRQPFMPNAVGEVESEPAAAPSDVKPAGPDPTRRQLLDWLRQVELDLPRPVLDGIFGDVALVSVPCIKIDFKPKEKS